ncbi:S-adenosyl-L-methionine-dependent methyltransferase [Fusarium flagelliforme]|uniref:S-adenosyl-L-methionine-dependent methyltransferase n=1 Tax=Fusarium flagelliforme TaxID=2675880 RepID=UPI001E8EC295|nr:S-adenosyl-L-methionine-dependent methyltransferase [Fusarium flagelliforme]KAH7198328.1 S-adenosyl-L-methionine-dependent methyltransferase [Fusarium flagelliforme]
MAEHPTEAESSPGQPAPSSSVPEHTAEQTPAEGSGEDFHGPEHWATLTGGNAPEEEDDADSAVGDDTASSTESMSSSILHYRTINGRTYHSERGNANYWTPNDEHHSESMDMAHHLLSLSLEGKLHLAPLKDDIQKVLDIGTGTGIWAIDFADEYPNAEVTGTDISPIQPSWIPPNLKFEIEDCTQEWTFEPDSFDYVHMRYMYGSISDWNALFREAYKACKPGGWCESFEASPRMESDDGTVTEDCAINEWGKFFIEGGRKLNRTFEIIDKDLQQKGMEEAGFVDIQTWDHKAPIGDWPKDPRLKEIGQFARATLEQDYEGYVMYMANIVLGWSREEVSLYCAQLRKEVRSGKFHPYYRQRVVYGRKPE